MSGKDYIRSQDRQHERIRVFARETREKTPKFRKEFLLAQTLSRIWRVSWVKPSSSFFASVRLSSILRKNKIRNPGKQEKTI